MVMFNLLSIGFPGVKNCYLKRISEENRKLQLSAILLSVFSSWSSSPFLIIPNTLLLLKGKQEFYCTGRALSAPHEGRQEMEFPLAEKESKNT